MSVGSRIHLGGTKSENFVRHSAMMELCEWLTALVLSYSCSVSSEEDFKSAEIWQKVLEIVFKSGLKCVFCSREKRHFLSQKPTQDVTNQINSNKRSRTNNNWVIQIKVLCNELVKFACKFTNPSTRPFSDNHIVILKKQLVTS